MGNPASAGGFFDFGVVWLVHGSTGSPRVCGASYQNDHLIKTHGGSRACVGRNLHPDQASYLRGKRYNGEKLTFAEAGAKRVASLDQNDPGSESTADRLAAEFKVSAPTIKRDGQYAAAVDKLATVGIEPQSVIAHVAKKAVGEIPSNSGELEPHRYCAQIPRMVDGDRGRPSAPTSRYSRNSLLPMLPKPSPEARAARIFCFHGRR